MVKVFNSSQKNLYRTIGNKVLPQCFGSSLSYDETGMISRPGIRRNRSRSWQEVPYLFSISRHLTIHACKRHCTHPSSPRMKTFCFDNVWYRYNSASIMVPKLWTTYIICQTRVHTIRGGRRHATSEGGNKEPMRTGIKERGEMVIWFAGPFP